MPTKVDHDDRDQLHPLGKELAEQVNSDIIIFAGGATYRDGTRFCKMIRPRKSRPNAMVLLTTFGGSADAGFKMARCLQDVYKDGQIRIHVDTYCKSAGTLIALAADEIIMSDDAEFGPVDVQLRKPEELEERTSGLTQIQALSTLQAEAYNAFESFFVTLRRKTLITSRISADVAAQLTVGLFGPIYAQLEPMRLGENQRAMNVAQSYGKLLGKVSGNLKRDGLDRLLSGYPSHSFAIDRNEAQEIFERIRAPRDKEERLASALRDYTLPRAIECLENEDCGALVDVLNWESRNDNKKQNVKGHKPLSADAGATDGRSNEAKRTPKKGVRGRERGNGTARPRKS